MKFIILSNYFPPYGPPVGYLRIYKIARFLKNKGHKVIIFSSKDELKLETQLGSEFEVIWIENSISIHKNKRVYNILKYIGWPDSKIGFFIKGLKKFKKIYKEFNPDLVIMSIPPFSTALFSIFIKKDGFIVDFRDTWSYDILQLNKNVIQKFLTNYFEKFLINKSLFCITVNEKISNYLINKHKLKKIFTIPHFWDSSIKIKKKEIKNHTLKIYYFGAIHPFKGFEKIFQAIEEFDNFEIHLFGDGNNEYTNKILKWNFVIYEGFIPFEKVIEKSSECDLLLISLDSFKGYEFITSSKEKELLALKKPIFAIVPKDNPMYEEFKIIKGVYLADINNQEDIRKTFTKIIKDWENGNLKEPQNIDIFKDEFILENFYKLIINFLNSSK